MAALATSAVPRRPLVALIGALICASLALGVLAAAAAPDETTAVEMLGFSSASALDEQATERRFDAALNAAELREWMRTMASAPNQVGSAHDKANAEFMLHKFRDWGWDANIETFSVLYPTPRHISLQMLAPKKFTARLHEPPIEGDAASAGAAGALPPYNVYGADGDVSGPLVYVNYGMPEDYKELDRRGISVKDTIVIARYRGGWRGLKPKLAYEHGAIGCLIYSDPRDDGYFAGDVYPLGGWRPADGVQRGSVVDLPVYPGDPLTPGVGATAAAQRLPLSEASTLMKIPVLPISYADAQPLLAALRGPVAPANWRGALPITYHIGAGPATVRLQVQSDWSQKTIYDVIAKITGSELPDEWVLRGNHHDGWVFGAWDPLSGNSALMAEAKAIGQLLATGWRPRRTLIYASWDGEEPGLLGSTEWAETHAPELTRHAVLYVNSDTNARGFLQADGSPSLQRLVNQVSAGIRDPESGGSVQARLRAKLRVDAYQSTTPNEQVKRLAQAAASAGDVPLGALGSGSDFTPFLQHLGIAALDISYVGEADNDGVYHSLYDSFDHFVRLADPGFVYGIAEAQTVGHLILRVADADVLPLQFSAAAETFDGYLRELHKLAYDQGEHAQILADLRQARVFELASDPTRPVGAPASEAAVPYLDFRPLDAVMARLQRSAANYDQALADVSASGAALSTERRTQLDSVLQELEPSLTSDQGLPGRPWYRHLIYAPGLYTGYAAKTMPGVREAIEQSRWEQTLQYIGITARAIDIYCDRLDAATALLRN
jgi:N-acetylated-alpha-linked acidic dipeptidase